MHGKVTQSTLALEMRWKNGNTYNWLRKSLTDGLCNILPIDTLEAVFWYLAFVCIFHKFWPKGS